MSRRFKICLTAWFAIVAVAACTGKVSGQEPAPVLAPADELLPLPKELSDVAPESTSDSLQQAFPEPPAAAALEPSLEPEPQLVPEPPQAPASGFSQPLPPVYSAAPVSDDNWQMQIRPALRVQMVAPATVVNPRGNANCEGCGSVNADDYARVYASIPFNRAEYDANPNYRHDSAMEILTGNARHQTIIRHSTTRGLRPNTAAVPTQIGNPYQYGYLRPALRLNYYRHFPSLNPYLNVWNLSGAF